jgi:thioredoxin reductase (NADPH)
VDALSALTTVVYGPLARDRPARDKLRHETAPTVLGRLEKLASDDGYNEVYTSDGKHYHARAVLIASGASYRRLDVPGEDDFIGAGIHFCATCDGPFYKGAKNIIVIGGGNSACEEGLHLTNFAEQVTLLVRGDNLTASQVAIDNINQPNSRVKVKFNVAIDSFEGENSKLKRINFHDTVTDEKGQIEPEAAFVFIGQKPNTEFAKDYLQLDKYGFVLTGHDLTHAHSSASEVERLAFETSMSGVFAAGDVRHDSVKQVASAVGEGAAAAIAIREFLKRS